MADPVIGAVTELLIGNLLDIVSSQSGYALKFKPQLKEMEKQLKLMRSFLADANKLKHKHETVKEILNSLRELIYEADDVIVDCQIREARRNMKGSSLCTFLSIPEIIFRYKTGMVLEKINSKISKFHQDLGVYITPLGVGNHAAEELGSGRRRWTSQVFDQSEIVGLTDDARRIKGWILPESESLHRVGIVGMGGLGKTTLAKKIFNDTQVMARYCEKIWISISQTVNEVEILKSMLRQLHADASGSDNGELLYKVSQRLANRSYLIVMDDVWSIDNGWWDRISDGIPMTKECSSCIMVTSRNKDVVRRMGVEKIHRVKVLDEKQSWTLFCKVAFKSSEGKCKNAQLEEEGRKIVRRCGGLPLAIKATGGLLASKPQSSGEWKRICENFYEKLENESASDISVMASLQLSYDELPPQLKHCMLCFSIYPDDHEIDAVKLVHWWVSEGFVRDKGTETAIEVAFDCLARLVSRCLVESVQRRSFDGKVYSCKVHDLVRDLTIKIAGEEHFGTFDTQGIQVTTINTRRLGVTKETTFQTLRGNAKLRALILTTFHSIGFKRDIALANVTSLRVLDLAHLKLDNVCLEDLWRWIISLKRLAYLNLSDVAKLFTVPDSIEKLWGLQTLILSENRDLKELPGSILTLPRLTILNVGNCPSLRFLPRGISRLVTLQELYGFKTAGADTPESCRFRDLQALTQLRVLHLDLTDESTVDDGELTALARLRLLRVLSINAGDIEDPKMATKLEKLSPPPYIEELFLRHFGGETTPTWMNPTALPQLLYLCIESSRTLTQMSAIFWNNGEYNWKVEGLCLKFLPRLQATWSDFRVMPIRYLEVSHCNSLEKFPCDVTGLGYWRFKEEKDRPESTSEDLPVDQPEECDIPYEI